MNCAAINMLPSKIFMQKCCFATVAAFIKSLAPSHVFIVTDSILGPLFSKQFEQHITGVTVATLQFEAGEAYKTRKTKEFCEDQMLQAGASRSSCVIGLGGGCVLDVAGFLASTYARGVGLVLVPTSLLAMVDASIGGKNGVNTPQGKNLIGTIYQPEAVYVDIDFLVTLPQEELKNGIVEMIKHALILDKNYFEFLEANCKAILARDPLVLEQAIRTSIAIKAAVVTDDEKEAGKRRLLNFGHTVGHAIETASGYSIPHGKAVALGIIAEGRLAVSMGYLQQSVLDRIEKLLNAFDIDLSTNIEPSRLYNIMCIDKKSHQGTPRVVMLKEIGACEHFNGIFCTEVSEALYSKNT